MIDSILENMGYEPDKSGAKWLRMKAIYRNGNSMSLAVDRETGWFQDFVTGQNGPLFRLVMMTLNLGEVDARKFLQGSYFDDREVKEDESDKIQQDKYFSKDFCSDLLPSYSFYRNRGISEQTLKTFQGGVKTYGKMNNRFVFPVYDSYNNLIGISGRDLFPNSARAKWKHLGKKNSFIYPHNITGKEIEESSQVILVESIGDALALYEAGVKNFLVTFGLSVSKNIILYLIRSNVQEIIVATNNDETSEENRGKMAAEQIKKKLTKYFNSDSVQIKLPTKKDFGDMSSFEIQKWYSNLKI